MTRQCGKPDSRFLNKRRIFQCVFLLILLSGLGGGFFLRGKVVFVTDGDTLTILTRELNTRRIRLYGIDCPEFFQPGGDEATKFTRSLAFLSDVEIKLMDTDRYGRAVALVALPDGALLNEELIRNGHAWVYDYYCRIPQCSQWRVLQKKAREHKTGLWGKNAKPVPPWVWRRQNR